MLYYIIIILDYNCITIILLLYYIIIVLLLYCHYITFSYIIHYHYTTRNEYVRNNYQQMIERGSASTRVSLDLNAMSLRKGQSSAKG